MLRYYEIGSQYIPSGVQVHSHSQRRKGLRKLDIDHAPYEMVFANCRSIHTFGMRFEIRTLFLDKDNVILGVRVVCPRRIVFAPRGTKTIVEQPFV